MSIYFSDSMGFNEDWGDNVDPGEILDNFKDDDFDNEDNLQVDEGPSTTSKEDSNYSQVSCKLFLYISVFNP